MYFLKRYVFLITLIGSAQTQKKEGDSCVDQYTNTVGKCTSAESCTSARVDFQQNGIRPTFCTYSAFGATLVCCRDGTTILDTAGPKPMRPIWGTDTNTQNDKRRVSERSDTEPTTPKYKEEIYPQQQQYQDELQNGYHHENIIPDVASKIPEPADPAEKDLITKVWSIKLKRMTHDQSRLAEKIINDVLFEAELGTLTKDSLSKYSLLKCQNLSQVKSHMTLYENTSDVSSLSSTEEQSVKDSRNPVLQLSLTVNNPEETTKK